MDTSENYSNHYALTETIFPSAFAAKVFLGNTHGIRDRIKALKSPSLLEIGFGDGRDLMLFKALNYKITGLELNKNIVDLARKRLVVSGSDIDIDLRVGSNTSLPLEKCYDIIYSSAAVYYLEKESVDMIDDILTPIEQSLNKSGLFVATFAKRDTHYIKDSTMIKKNTYLIEDKLFKLRPKQLIYAVETEEEMHAIIEQSGLNILKIGNWTVDWFGVNESMYMVIAEKL